MQEKKFGKRWLRYKDLEVENGTGTAEIDRQIIPNTNRIIRFGWLKCELNTLYS